MQQNKKPLKFTFRTCQVTEEGKQLVVRVPLIDLAWWGQKVGETRWSKKNPIIPEHEGVVLVACHGDAVKPRKDDDDWHNYPLEAQWLGQDAVAFRFNGGATYGREPLGPGMCLQVDGQVDVAAGVRVLRAAHLEGLKEYDHIWVEAKDRPPQTRAAVAPHAGPDDQPHQPG